MGEIIACRLCLSTNIKLFNMFHYRLHSTYATLTGNKMTMVDGLPPYVCGVCYTLLVKSATFKQMCENSLNLLKYALGQQELSTEYIKKLKIVHPFSLTTKTNKPIDNTENTVKEEVWDWGFEESSTYQEKNFEESSPHKVKDFEEFSSDKVNDYDDDYKVKDESSDEEPLSTKVQRAGMLEVSLKIKDEEFNDLPVQLDDDDFPNGEVDEVVLTMEQQLEEVQSRKTSMNYLNSFYKCDRCYKGFITDATYKNHMVRHDPSTGGLECEVCHIRLEHMRALRAHVMASHERKFICKLCNHISKSRHRAKEHSKWHSGLTYVCKFCGVSFSKSTSHLTHIRLHHPSKHTCYVCGESFIGETGLNMHKKKAHRNMKNLEQLSENRCTNCKIQFHNIQAFKRHTNNMEDVDCDLKLRPCAQCGQSYPTEIELKEHLKEHYKEEPVKCEECNRIFAHERSYALHYQRVHLKVRSAKKDAHATVCPAPVVCEICGQRCISNASLRYHQRTHTGERPYQCTECPKRFSISQRLQIHQRTHTGERPYKCSNCPKAFKHKAALNRHDRVHTGAKPYSCSHCGKSFSQSNSMKVHVRTVHLKLPSPYRARRPAAE